jgi:AraC-like DNA-binding protein
MIDLICDERTSDSPLIERIWRSRSSEDGTFLSMADTHWGIVVTTYRGRSILTVRGPETKATVAHTVSDVEFFGIQFKPGTLLTLLPPSNLIDRQDVTLPEAVRCSFWLGSTAWQLPSYDNAEVFVARLAAEGLLLQDNTVAAALRAEPVSASMRTVQRRFLSATGLTSTMILQIERARHAVSLLKRGDSILDVVDLAGYYDQPHLTRELRRFIGLTPAQIADTNRNEALSFLYNTGNSR